MFEQVRAMIQMASGVAEIPKAQAEKLARSLSDKGLKVGQVSSIAEDIVKRSQENAEMVRSLVSSEIRRQMKAMGLATKDDIDRLNRRLFDLAKADEVEKLTKRLEKVEQGPSSTAVRPKPKPKAATPKKATSKKAR